MKIQSYDFSDQVVDSFTYESKQKMLSIGFDAYCYRGQSIEQPCKVIISEWSAAQSRTCGNSSYEDLKNNLGIPSLLLSVQEAQDSLLMVVNTLDDRYIELMFINASVCSGQLIPDSKLSRFSTSAGAIPPL